MTVIGLDGFRRGWVAAWSNGASNGLMFLDNIAELLKFPHKIAMIDIPIGLPESGYRTCDLEAKQLLGAHASRVFTGARRPLLKFKSREQAHDWFKRRGEPGVSCQLWCLTEKIRQVDQIMTPERQRTIKETHPELVFLRLNHDEPLPGKKTPDGRLRRRDLIFREGFIAIDKWLEHCRLGTGAKPDDVLDACACAIAARDGRIRLPQGRQETDERDLKMEIWS